MAKSTSGTMKSRGENINHINAVRFRVLGSGNLRLRLLSLPDSSGDPIDTETLSSIVMSNNTAIEPTKLANFKQQRTQLELKTTEINETFKIVRIIIFGKAIATGYPQ
jgi:hypothetical protein